jgi:uncharacterized protein YdhG (YjbR/CyaY superfamily)
MAMQAPKVQFRTVDQYISVFPKHVQAMLQQMRETVQKAAPQAEEVISYNMPAFRFHGMLVYYAGNKAHIGFYPMPAAIVAFKKELAGYVTSKGAIQFPLDKKLPVTLIKNIVRFRMLENEEKEKLKKK